MSLLTVTTTYLHLPGRGAFRPALSEDPDLLVLESRETMPEFYRFLYKMVGRNYAWYDRLDWTDEQLRAHLSRRSVILLLLYTHGTPAGYIELEAEAEEPGTEIAYFGLFPAFHGRGYGKHLLSSGVQRAFADGATRVWLHTCSLDGPYALANYQARGFLPYRTTTTQQEIPAIVRATVPESDV